MKYLRQEMKHGDIPQNVNGQGTPFYGLKAHFARLKTV